MKEFLVKDYLTDKEFLSCLKAVMDAGNDRDKLNEAFIKLDKFVSLKSGVKNSPLVFTSLKEKGRFEFEDFVLVNENMINCKNNIELIEVYLHEKRHHFQYNCYLQNDDLLGQKMLDEIKEYFEKKDVCAISKKSVFEGVYGYYGRSMEQDAYDYGYKQTIKLLENLSVFGPENERETFIRKYAARERDLSDAELIHWIEMHKKRFEVRKIVEEEMIEKIREMIRYDIGNKLLRRIIYSRTLFECLDNEEKLLVANVILGVSPKQVEKSDLTLERIINKNVTKAMKEKRSR